MKGHITYRVFHKDGREMSRSLYSLERIHDWFVNFRPWREDIRVEDFLVKDNSGNTIDPKEYGQ